MSNFKIGDRVKVIQPCPTSENKRGCEGIITTIKDSYLIGFGKCVVHQIDNNWYEHASGLIKADTFADEVEANIAKQVKEEQMVEV